MKNIFTNKILLFLALIVIGQNALAQCNSGTVVNGLYVNEFGQGDSGTEDWAELIAVESSGGNLDLTGWIFDDNNNDASGVGNADGFLIFDPTNDVTCAALASVPSGTLIVLYNESDKYGSIPADDLDPSDGTLVLPASSICFDANSGNDYSVAADASTPSWNLVAFRNGGDAVTTGTTAGIFHQLYYGDIDATEVSSGGVQVDLPAVGGGDQAAFGCGSYGDTDEYSVSSTGTPTAGNSSDNTNYVTNVEAGNLDCSDLDAACSAAATCPDGLASLTANAVVVSSESTCEADGVTLSGGVIAAAATNNCPTETTLEYSVDGGSNWNTSLPTYNQTTAETILTRCNCDADNSVSSAQGSVLTDPGTCPSTLCTLPVVTVVAKCTNDSGATDIEAGEDMFFIQITISDLGSDSDGDNEVTVTVAGAQTTYNATGTYYVGPYNHSGTGTTTIPVSYENDGESCSDTFVVSEVICGFSADGDQNSDGSEDDDLHASGPACDCNEDPMGWILAQVAPGSFDASSSVMIYILADANGDVVEYNNTGKFEGLTNQAYNIYPYNVSTDDVMIFEAAIPASGDPYTGFTPPSGACSAGCGSAPMVLECRCDDVAIMKVVSTTGALAVGSDVTFTITVLNQGNSDIYNVVVADYLPSGLDFVQADNAGNAFASNTDTPGGGTVTATVATSTPIAPGGSLPLTIILKINNTAGSMASLTNEAEITGASQDAANTMPINDEDDALAATGGGTEDDNNVDDGGMDDPDDQDDFDFAVVSLCSMPVAPTVVGASYCLNEVIAALEPTGVTGAFFSFYADSGLQVLLATGATYTPTGAGTFFVTQTDPLGCEGPATEVQIIVRNTNCGSFPWNGTRTN